MPDSSSIYDSLIHDSIRVLRASAKKDQEDHIRNVLAALCFSMKKGAGIYVPLQIEDQGEQKKYKIISMDFGDGSCAVPVFSDRSEADNYKGIGKVQQAPSDVVLSFPIKDKTPIIINPFTDKIIVDIDQLKEIQAICADDKNWHPVIMLAHKQKAFGIITPAGVLVLPESSYSSRVLKACTTDTKRERKLLETLQFVAEGTFVKPYVFRDELTAWNCLSGRGDTGANWQAFDPGTSSDDSSSNDDTGAQSDSVQRPQLPLDLLVPDEIEFNFALYCNGVMPLRDIRLVNNAGFKGIEQLTLRIHSDHPLFAEYENKVIIKRQLNNVSFLEDPRININYDVIVELVEADNTFLKVELL